VETVATCVPQGKLRAGEDREICLRSSAPRDYRKDTGPLRYSRISRSPCPKGTASA
jgi:hypothetical protein